ncbi:hypothetical protein D3C84_786950 [compost metagenome]
MIVDMNPRHPLPTIADTPAQRQFEWQQQPRQKAALGRQDQAGTNQHHAYAQRLGPLCGFFPGNAQLAGEIFAHRPRLLGQLTLTTVAIPAHRGTGNQYLRFLLATLQPRQQNFRQRDATAPQQHLALVAPGPIGNRRSCEVEHRVHRLDNFIKLGNASHICATDFRHLFGSTTPYRQAMSLPQPEAAELTSDQTSTAGQQYVHEMFLASRFTRPISLFL